MQAPASIPRLEMCLLVSKWKGAAENEFVCGCTCYSCVRCMQIVCWGALAFSSAARRPSAWPPAARRAPKSRRLDATPGASRVSCSAWLRGGILLIQPAMRCLIFVHPILFLPHHAAPTWHLSHRPRLIETTRLRPIAECLKSISFPSGVPVIHYDLDWHPAPPYTAFAFTLICAGR